jgi:hypothetical protein
MEPTDRDADGQKPRRFIPLLRLVSPALLPAPTRKKGLRGPPVFTAEEEACLRSSLRTGRHVLGSWKALAAAMHVNAGTLQSVVFCKRKRVTAEIAVRLAKALRVPLEAITRPGLRPVKAPCPSCGGAA